MIQERNEGLVENEGNIKVAPSQAWGRGIIADVKRTVGTHWCNEVSNFNKKTVAVSLQILIIIIPPTLAFGASYSKMSENRIGTIETILATSWVGVVYSVIGGMPLCIIGSTAPILALSTAVKNMSDTAGVDYLHWNAWISIWLLGYCVLAGFFDLTRFIKLATRFTDEIFALLIVLIFVMDAVGNPFSESGILRYFDPDHSFHTQHQNEEDYDYMSVALLSMVLGFGTTWLVFVLKSFKFSSFFCNDTVRTAISDSSVIISVVIWTVVNYVLFPGINTEKLKVPDTFEPTLQCCTTTCETVWPEDCSELDAPAVIRPWIVDLSNVPSWAPFAAAGPAFMAFLLFYLDNGITWHLVNHKSNNIKHGTAYNYDLCLNGIFNCINGLLGLPWLVATTVPSIIHIKALANKDNKGHILEIQETRLTMFFSHLLLGLSMLFLGALKLLPVPVLYGVFLSMGLSSLPRIQLWNRFLLFFQQPSRYPETVFTKFMEKRKVHRYTVLQLLFLCGIFAVMNIETISIAFPFIIFLCIPARLYLLPTFFYGWELVVLDGEDDAIEEWTNAKHDSVRDFSFCLADDNKAMGVANGDGEDDAA